MSALAGLKSLETTGADKSGGSFGLGAPGLCLGSMQAAVWAGQVWSACLDSYGHTMLTVPNNGQHGFCGHLRFLELCMGQGLAQSVVAWGRLATVCCPPRALQPEPIW